MRNIVLFDGKRLREGTLETIVECGWLERGDVLTPVTAEMLSERKTVGYRLRGVLSNGERIDFEGKRPIRSRFQKHAHGFIHLACSEDAKP